MSTSRIGRRFDPDHARLRTHCLRQILLLRQIDEADIEICRTTTHALEHAERAAVQIVHRDDVTAGVDELQQRAGRRHAGSEGEAMLAAF
jgi:hypothetical protein